MAWPRVIACRSLANDLAGTRPGRSGQTAIVLHDHQRELLVDLLTREADRVERSLTDLFDQQLASVDDPRPPGSRLELPP
jgi:hypothetical protein